MAQSAATVNEPAGTVTVTRVETGQSYTLPLYAGALGPPVFDIRKLYADTGMFTYDPGFMSTASCQSRITYIDGEKGILLYRGYAIEDLAEHSTFTEVAYLLLYGELPTTRELSDFNLLITRHTMIHEQLTQLFRGFRRDAHPMAIMVGVVGALSAFYHDNHDIHDARQRLSACLRLIAKIPTIAAMAYKYSIGQPFVFPRNDLTFAENFLHMMFSVPAENYHVDSVLARAIDDI